MKDKAKLVSFISCVNDEKEYSKCVEKIRQLECDPDCYEIVAIRNAHSMTSGYNEGMRIAKGTYKIYLHQDVYIQNKTFVQDVTEIFQKDASIGLIGMVGAEKIPSSSVWSDGKHIYGGVIENSLSETNELAPFPTEEFVGDIKIVEAVDGLLMATQYDIPWREDIFDGWDFYDASQCIEFKRKGYQVCVPQQKDTIWTIHDCKDVNLKNFYKYRKIFRNEYAKDIYKMGALTPLFYDFRKAQRKWQKPLETYVKRVFKRLKK